MSISTQNPSVLPAVLTFEGAELRVIDREGQLWITGVDLSRALGYVKDQHVSNIYQRNQHEFKPSMTQVITLRANEYAQSPKLRRSERGQSNLTRQVRVFSLRGAHLIGMFAQTAKASAFRSWVLDVLEGIATAPITQPGQSLAALIADNVSGPALSEIPAILAACGQRLSGAMCLPHWQSAPAPSEMAEFVATTRALSVTQLQDLAAAALHRVAVDQGESAVTDVIQRVDGDWCLVSRDRLLRVHNSLSFEMMFPPQLGERQ